MLRDRGRVKVGVVSDTHGLFDPKLVELFRGTDLIIHGGDVCGEAVLRQLEAVAPVRAIHGNCDVPPLSEHLPPWRLEQLAGHRILVLHDLGKPERPRPAAQSLLSAARPSIVISGHSHQGRIAIHGEVLYVNPGGAGPKRFKLLRSAARLTLGPEGVEARLFSLESTPPTVVARTRFGKRATLAAPER